MSAWDLDGAAGELFGGAPAAVEGTVDGHGVVGVGGLTCPVEAVVGRCGEALVGVLGAGWGVGVGA